MPEGNPNQAIGVRQVASASSPPASQAARHTQLFVEGVCRAAFARITSLRHALRFASLLAPLRSRVHAVMLLAVRLPSSRHLPLSVASAPFLRSGAHAPSSRCPSYAPLRSTPGCALICLLMPPAGGKGLCTMFVPHSYRATWRARSSHFLQAAPVAEMRRDALNLSPIPTSIYPSFSALMQLLFAALQAQGCWPDWDCLRAISRR